MDLLNDISAKIRKSIAVLEMKNLDSLSNRYSISREESLHGTIRWLMLAQDSTMDDGVSYGFSLYEGWTVSYPETTGYIIQTFLWYYDQFGKQEVFYRAKKMAHWEVDIQLPNGSIPGKFGTANPIPVAFNTGQVLLGWAEYLKHDKHDVRVREAGINAGNWLIRCLGDGNYFKDGVSDEAEHGELSYNSMVSWGLAELGIILNRSDFIEAASRTAKHYASIINERNWPYKSGFSDLDSKLPLTHTLGYSIQGVIETGNLTKDIDLLSKGKKLADAAISRINLNNGFLPGRIGTNWSEGSKWACLTGSAQFAYIFLRLKNLGFERSVYIDAAIKLIDFIVGTQIREHKRHMGVVYGVRGSYPFSFNGYQAATLPNWAAKFLIDAEVELYKIGRL